MQTECNATKEVEFVAGAVVFIKLDNLTGSRKLALFLPRIFSLLIDL